MYRTKCTMYNEVYMGNPGKVPYCNERDQFEPDCTNCERPNVTKADRIRGMSDEELAKWLSDMIYPECVCCPADNDGWCKDCKTKWLNWLKQEGGND